MSEQSDIIAQFIQVSGTDEDVARFYLTSSNWSLEDALNNFLGGQNDDSPTSDTTASGADRQIPSSTSTSTSTGARGADTFQQSAPKPKFATMGDMSKRSSNDDDEQGQAFYAGGSDRSGQQVLGPPKRKNFRDQLTDMFRMAQEQGAIETVSPGSSSTNSPNRGASVWGQGMRLGMTDSDHTAVASQSAAHEERKPVVVLKLWNEGFSIDDGELRHYEDPENKEFLETVMRGEIPQELLDMGRMVNVDVEDHRPEDYKTKQTPPTFKGSGHTLGSPVPSVAEVKPPTAAAATSAAASNNTIAAQNEAKAREALNINASEPTTTVQIRLADGTRLAGQFNLTHTVSDIRHFIQNARPQYGNSNFILVSSFPTRELTDETSTIESAGLKNAALMQRLK